MNTWRKIPLSLVLLFMAFLAALAAVFPKASEFFGFLENKHDLVGGISDFMQIVALSISALFGLAGIYARLSERRAAKADTEIAEREANKWRQDLLSLLKEVRRQWITEYLDNSLYHRVMIELGKEVRPEAVYYPWHMDVEMPGLEPRPLPPEQSLTALFFDFNEKLLILGAPGSGKTISLLTLARELLAEAEADPERPIPVVFNLSSWARKCLPLMEWMQIELKEKYYRGAQVTGPWLEQQRLLPLLDSLDEVPEPHRAACAGAINAYAQENHRAGLVVCCRDADYRALPQKLRLHGAVCLQPLDDVQIETYLDRAGVALHGLRANLVQDAGLRELAKSPLMLNVMSVAYQNLPVGEAQPSLPLDPSRRQAEVFDRYVDKMFVRKGERAPLYPREQTLRWLGWLASRLRRHGQTLFLLENLQPEWGNRGILLIAWLSAMAAIGGIAGFIGGGLFHLTWFGRPMDAVTGSVFGAGFVMVLGLGLFPVFSLGGIEPHEEFVWNWPTTVRKAMARLAGYGLVMLVTMILVALLTFVVVRQRLADPGAELFWGVPFLLGNGLVVCFVTFFLAFVESRTTPHRITPNQGIHASLRNVWRFGWIGVVFGILTLTGSYFVATRYGYSGPQHWVVAAWGGFLMVFLFFGGQPALEHYVLRLALYVEGSIPWNYVRFLDYASRLILLQKVGGGFVFIHRLLLEHMADRYEAETVSGSSPA